MIPILPPIQRKSEIPILPPIQKIEIKKEIKCCEFKKKKKTYNQSLSVKLDVVDVSVKVIELTNDLKIKCPFITSKCGNKYYLFQPLIKLFTKTNNNQRILYRFKSPEEKFSTGKKMYLTSKGLQKYIKMITCQKNRKNGIFNHVFTELFLNEISTFLL
jgi:hypothetical protein